MRVEPLTPSTPVAPDADWETVRARMTAAELAASPDWTDHNAIEPATTLSEAVAFDLAALHHRTHTRTLADWPLEVPDWLPDAERHWYAALPDAPAVAAVLAGPSPTTGTVAEALEPLIAAAPARDEALALLATPPWAGVVPAELTDQVVAVLRARLVRRFAQELADLVARAMDAQLVGTRAERDAAAAQALVDLPLWPTEREALVRRERRRRSAETVRTHLAEVLAATTPAAVTATRTVLGGDDLSPAEVDAAMAAARVPLGVLPEDLEQPDGAATLWPPHPIQALTCEPVTAQDYARRARAHPQVGRAWAVRGRLEGVGWDGRPVTAEPDRLGAVTLVVERVAGDGDTPAFLRAVLAAAIGSEVVQPHPTWQDSYDPLDPRRLICDEVGAAVLRHCPLAIQGHLVAGPGVDRAALVAGALDRVATLLDGGPPGAGVVAAPDPSAVDGPWPRIDQPTGGWVPGAPVRFADVVRALTDDPLVLGVTDLAISVGSTVHPASEGSVPLDPDCVPELAERQCLTVELVLAADCGSGGGGCGDA